MSNNNHIFRKESLDRVSSPEQLKDYIKVSRPSVWMVLVSVIVLLIGVLAWGVLGTLTTTRNAVAIVTEGKTICYVNPKDATILSAHMPVHIGTSVGTIASVDPAPIEISADFDSYALYLGNFKTGDWVVPITVNMTVSDGVYQAKIILESISPISFVLN